MKYKNQQAIREELDKELGGYKIDGKEFREMWGLFDLVLNFLDEQLSKKEEEVKKEFERFRNNLVTEDMNMELEEQLKTQTKK